MINIKTHIEKLRTSFEEQDKAMFEHLLAQINEKVYGLGGKYLQMFQHSNDPILIINENGIIENANQAFVDILNYDKIEDFIGKGPDSFSPTLQDDGQLSTTKAKANMQEAFEKGFAHFEWMHVRKNGQQFYVDVTLNAFKHEGKLKLFGVWREITKRKQAQFALEQNELMMRTIFDKAPVGVVLLDEEFKIKEANKVFYELLDYPVEFYRENSFYNYSVYEEAKHEETLIQEIKAGKRDSFQITKRYIKQDDSFLWVKLSVSVIKNRKGIIWNFIAVVEDINESFLNEIELNKLSIAIEQSHFSVIMTDTFGDIEYVNPYFYDLTGYCSSEVLGKNPRILKTGLTPESEYVELWNNISTGKQWKGEFLNKKKDGTHYHELAVIAPVKNKAGVITNYIALKEDISEIKITQQKLTEAVATKDKFFSIIAHDLKTPFSILLGFTELLDKNFDKMTDEKKKRFIKMMRQSTTQTYDLLEKLLTWSRTQNKRIRFNPTYLSLTDSFSKVLNNLDSGIKSKKIHVELLIQPEMTLAYADPDLLETILRNLISNALKFTPKYGRIRVEAKFNEANHIIKVSDTGVGIRDEDKHKLFKVEENFSTVGIEKEGGTGLGLILVKEFVELHGGYINFQSTLGEGTTFTFTLPDKKEEKLPGNSEN